MSTLKNFERLETYWCDTGYADYPIWPCRLELTPLKYGPNDNIRRKNDEKYIPFLPIFCFGTYNRLWVKADQIYENNEINKRKFLQNARKFFNRKRLDKFKEIRKLFNQGVKEMVRDSQIFSIVQDDGDLEKVKKGVISEKDVVEDFEKFCIDE